MVATLSVFIAGNRRCRRLLGRENPSNRRNLIRNLFVDSSGNTNITTLPQAVVDTKMETWKKGCTIYSEREYVNTPDVCEKNEDGKTSGVLNKILNEFLLKKNRMDFFKTLINATKAFSLLFFSKCLSPCWYQGGQGAVLLTQYSPTFRLQPSLFLQV